MEEKKESDYYSGLVQLITDPDLTAARVDAASGRDNKVGRGGPLLMTTYPLLWKTTVLYELVCTVA